ncbi:winged helix-turn-helix domain-containing protein [Candidatus Falkowbacteria bacterium]|nr:winged helix-turn-helix domain-containing protein [Candidatus Falkowbacteria bacterium]
MNHAHTLSLSHRDRTAMERRRLKAAKLFAKGRRQADVARTLGVSREAVRQWHDIWKKKGKIALQSAGKPGPKSQLTPEKLRLVKKALLRGPTAHGFATQLWTLERIAAMIRKVADVSHGTTRVWQVLQSLNWSCQRPETRAHERNEAAIRRWQNTAWPRIKKKQCE